MANICIFWCFPYRFLKIISVRLTDINLVKNAINVVNLVKIGRFWWKWSKLGHFWGKNHVICQNLGKVVKLFFPLKFLKIISVRFMDRTLVKNVIEAKFGQNRSFLVKMVKSGSFLGPKWHHMSTFGEIGQIFFSLKFSKNYFYQIYGHKCGKKSH